MYEDKKDFLYRMIGLFVLMISLFFFLGDYDYLNNQDKYIEHINAEDLIRIEILDIKEEDFNSYIKNLQKFLGNRGIIIDQHLNFLYTNEWFQRERILLDIKEEAYIKNMILDLKEGEWFSNETTTPHTYQAIVSRALSNRYEVGNAYTINLDSLQNEIDTLDIEIVGVLDNNFYFNMGSGSITKRRNNILIYDPDYSINRFYNKGYFSSVEICSLLIKKNSNLSYEALEDVLWNYPNIYTINYIYDDIVLNLAKDYKSLIIPLVMSITLSILTLVSILSNNLFDFLRKKQKYILFYKMGIKSKHYILMFLSLSFITTIIPFFIAHLISYFFYYIQLYYYNWVIGITTWLLIFCIHYVSNLLLLIFILQIGRNDQLSGGDKNEVYFEERK